jgi:hypothetical protein
LSNALYARKISKGRDGYTRREGLAYSAVKANVPSRMRRLTSGPNASVLVSAYRGASGELFGAREPAPVEVADGVNTATTRKRHVVKR